MHGSHCHQPRDEERKPYDEAEDVSVVARKPGSDTGHSHKYSELQGYSCVGCGENQVDHVTYSGLRSPARMGTVIQFSCGGRAHEYWSEYAQNGA